MSFSVLQSVYYNDNPVYLDDSFKSTASQTLKPDKFILVKDGNLTPQLEQVIAEWKDKLPLQIVGYEKNQGLAYALNYGLQFCDTEYIVRMDSDDISVSDRFEKQIAFMERNPDIVLSSGIIDEFIDDPDCIASTRYVPSDYQDIIHYLKKRNAFNHMAVIMKKSAIEAVGGYQIVPYFEDYDLWIRLVQSGYQVANLSEHLVKARIGNDMIGRRHGLKYCKYEFYFLKRQLKSRFLTIFDFTKLIILRIPVRLLPKNILSFIYKFLRR